jgi:hypothetical protein
MNPTLTVPGTKRLKLTHDKPLSILPTFWFQFQLAPLQHGHSAAAPSRRRRHRHLGGAVQVDPMKPKLKAPGTDRLKLKYDEPP